MNNLIDIIAQNKIPIVKHGNKLAVGDAEHDFKKYKSQIEQSIKVLKEGLPKPYDDSHPERGLTEEQAINALLDCPQEDDVPKNFQQLIYDYLPNNTNDSPDFQYQEKPVNIGIGDLVLHNYNACTFNIASSNNDKVKSIFPNGLNLVKSDDFANRFTKNTKLGGLHEKGCAFVLDFSQHHFFESLASGNEALNANGNQFEILYAITPEIVNDPAGKPNENDPKYFGANNANKGVNIKPIIQNGPDPVVYNAYDDDSAEYNNFFLSTYNFSLSPIKQNYTSKSKAKFVSMSIWNKSYRVPINDSKGENSVKSIENYIRKIINKMSVHTPTVNDAAKTKFEIFCYNTKLQQKRGGDWFQELCCLDVMNRKYNDLSDDKRNIIEIDKNYPIYFVSHDRIAVSYALLLGINVIYIDFYGKISVFKNKNDPNTLTSNVNPKLVLYESIYNKLYTKKSSVSDSSISIPTTNISGPARNLKNFIEFYNEKRVDLINSLYEALYRRLQIISTTLNDDDDNDNTNNSLTKLKDLYIGTDKHVQNLFQILVKLAYINIVFPDLCKSYKNFNVLQIEFKKLSNANNFKEGEKITELNESDPRYQRIIQESNMINEISKEYNILNFYNKKYSNYSYSTSISGTNWMNNYINTTCIKLDVYKCVSQFLNYQMANTDETTISSRKFVKRLIDINTGNKYTKTDRFIFLAYVQELFSFNGDENKTKFQFFKPIIEFFNKSRNIIVGYLAGQESKSLLSSGFAAVVRKMRSNRQKPEDIELNIISNFIYESLCIFNNNENSSQFGTIINLQPVIPLTNCPPDTPISDDNSPVDNISTSNEDDEIVTDMLLYLLNQTEINISNSEVLVENMTDFLPNNDNTADDNNEIEGNENAPPLQEESEQQESEQQESEQQESGQNIVVLDQYSRIHILSKLATVLLDTGEEKIKILIDFLEEYNQNQVVSSNTEPSYEDVINNFLNNNTSNLLGGNLNEDNSNTIENKTLNIEELLSILKNLFFHPLCPLYILTYSFYFQVSPKYENFCFIDNYINLFKKINSMYLYIFKLLNTKDESRNSNLLAAYLIGLGINTMFFSSTNNIEITKFLSSKIDNYIGYQLCIDNLSESFCGYNDTSKITDEVSIKLINNDLFLDFITKTWNNTSPPSSTPEQIIMTISNQESIMENQVENLNNNLHQLLININTQIQIPIDNNPLLENASTSTSSSDNLNDNKEEEDADDADDSFLTRASSNTSNNDDEGDNKGDNKGRGADNDLLPIEDDNKSDQSDIMTTPTKRKREDAKNDKPAAKKFIARPTDENEIIPLDKKRMASNKENMPPTSKLRRQIPYSNDIREKRLFTHMNNRSSIAAIGGKKKKKNRYGNTKKKKSKGKRKKKNIIKKKNVKEKETKKL
jgi:hypothetical protein